MTRGMMTPIVSKPTKAVWWLQSENQEEWNTCGTFIYKGMRGIPLEADYKIQELILDYGDPPSDLEWGISLGTFKYFIFKVFGNLFYTFLYKPKII